MKKINPSHTTDHSKQCLLATQEELDEFVKKGGKVTKLQPREYLDKASKDFFVTTESDVTQDLFRNQH